MPCRKYPVAVPTKSLFESNEPPAQPDPPASSSEPMSVAALSALIVDALEDGLPRTLRVEGELSNLKRSRNGHWYFSLKDETSKVDCAMWSARARGVTFEPEDGDAVEVTGHVEHYAKQGRTQLIVERLKSAGLGTLQARFEAMCSELREAGWFDAEHKQELPMLPRRIAVLTAAGSAALADVQRTSRDRCPSVSLVLVDVPVQGEGAAPRIAEAIRRVDAAADSLDIDAMLVTRGGGSLEDLWSFNERVVAEAIFNCSTPIVAAIGHESDTSIAELVADHRASTPTQAVVALMPDAQDLQRQFDDRERRLQLFINRRFEFAMKSLEAGRDRLRSGAKLLVSQRLHALERRIGLLAERRPERQLAARRTQVATRSLHLRNAIGVRIQHEEARLARWSRDLPRQTGDQLGTRRSHLYARSDTLEAIGPRAVLERGFSVTVDEAGRALRSTGGIEVGALLTSHFSDGRVLSRVEGVKHGENDPSGTVEAQ